MRYYLYNIEQYPAAGVVSTAESEMTWSGGNPDLFLPLLRHFVALNLQLIGILSSLANFK